MMKVYKIFFAILILSICSISYGASKAHKLLIVDSTKAELYRILREAMVDELARLGYKDKENLAITYYSLAHYDGRARNIWRKEKDKNYDVIFVNGTVATKAFKELVFGDKKINVVFGNITDPVGVGVIDDFKSPPKANFTGVSYPVKVEERFKFIMDIMPNAKTFGMVYADMPQSHSYRNWVEKMLKKPQFKHIEVVFRQVDFIKSEGGHKRMAQLAQKHIKDLDKDVDAFVSPNDMMGGQEPFAKMVYNNASKPLIGLGRNDVMKDWGATMAIYPSLVLGGKKVAGMIKQLFEGKSIKSIIPSWPETGVAIDINKARKYGLDIPNNIIEQAGDSIIK